MGALFSPLLIAFPVLAPSSSKRLAAWGQLLLACSLLVGPYSIAQEGENQSRYQRTVQSLQSAERELRVRFATIALLELAEIYIAEADLARRQSEEAESPDKLKAWSRAVDRYASQLGLVLEDVEFGLPVELRNNPHEVSSVSVGGRTIILAHPRRAQQLAYEQSILAIFCAGSICSGLTEEQERGNPIPVTASTVSPHWDFSAEGPVCRYQKLQVLFSSGGGLGRQRSLCEQLMQEVETLATELAWQQRHGVDVRWGELELRATPGRPEHLVVLNEAGDSLLATVPLLYGTPGLLLRLSPWLQRRHSEGGPPELSINAAAVGWE